MALNVPGTTPWVKTRGRIKRGAEFKSVLDLASGPRSVWGEKKHAGFPVRG